MRGRLEHTVPAAAPKSSRRNIRSAVAASTEYPRRGHGAAMTRRNAAATRRSAAATRRSLSREILRRPSPPPRNIHAWPRRRRDPPARTTPTEETRNPGTARDQRGPRHVAVRVRRGRLGRRPRGLVELRAVVRRFQGVFGPRGPVLARPPAPRVAPARVDAATEDARRRTRGAVEYHVPLGVARRRRGRGPAAGRVVRVVASVRPSYPVLRKANLV